MGSGDIKHRAWGIDAQRVWGRSGTIKYVAKYVAKEAAGSEVEHFGGRCWGVRSRELLTINIVSVALSWGEFYEARRVMRAWLERRVGGRVYSARQRYKGVTCYLVDEWSFRILQAVTEVQ